MLTLLLRRRGLWDFGFLWSSSDMLGCWWGASGAWLKLEFEYGRQYVVCIVSLGESCSVL